MNLTSIVLKNLKKRLLSTTLTISSITLGIAMVVAVLVIQQETERSFNQTSVGYDLLFAAKGSQLQATLNTLYHLETSVGIIPIGVYEAAKRDPRVEIAFPFYVGDSYRGYRVVGTSANFIEKAEPRRGQPFRMAEGRNFERPLEAVFGSEVARRTGHKIGDEIFITHGLSEPAPGAEAHVHDDVPVIIVGILEPSGTANDRAIFTDLYTTHALHDVHLHLHDDHHDHGHGHEHHAHEHSHGHEHDTQKHTHDHGHTDEQHSHDHHDHGHSHGHHEHHSHSHGQENGHTHDHTHGQAASQVINQIELKELDAVLVRMVNPAAAIQIAGMINFPTPDNPLLARNMMRDPFFAYKEDIMAVVPAMQIRNLMSIVGNAEQVLRLVAWFVVIVALFSVLIAIYNTMEERKRDLAVMRALGAKRGTIFSIIVMESAVICAIGALAGLLFGHIIVANASAYLAEMAGIVITAFNIELNQILLILVTVLAGILVGTIPALKAYRTDAVQNLGSGK
ncbi:MAG: ABC transporter permease [Bacteroidetes bacterium]|nr:ABC transporter permease [Bacteroidota bacterium]MCH8522962.1 ABC transporter permease [Balneolales bacterium]